MVIHQVLVKDYYYIRQALDCKNMLHFTKNFMWTPIFLLPLQSNSQYSFLNAHGSKKRWFLNQHCALTAPGRGCFRVTCLRSPTQLHEAFMMEPHHMEILVLTERSSLGAGSWVERDTPSRELLSQSFQQIKLQRGTSLHQQTVSRWAINTQENNCLGFKKSNEVSFLRSSMKYRVLTWITHSTVLEEESLFLHFLDNHCAERSLNHSLSLHLLPCISLLKKVVFIEK